MRVVGIVAIVAGHVWDTPIARAGLYSWHVPVFFFLSGYLWSSGRSVRLELRSRWRTLGLPYMSWLLILGVPFLVAVALDGGPLLEEAVKMAAGGAYLRRPFSAFWFMTALFVACLLFRILERLPRLVVWLVASCALGATYVLGDIVAKLPWAVGTAFAALVFVLAGEAFRGHIGAIRRPVVTAIAMLAVCGILVSTGVSAPMDMKQADFGTPVVSVAVAIGISCALVLLARAVFDDRVGHVSGAFSELAVVGTMVVLAHAAVLWVMRTPSVGTWMDFVLALLLPWSVALLIARTPLSTVLIGASRRPWPDIAVRRGVGRGDRPLT